MNPYKFQEGFNLRRFLVIISLVSLVSYGIFNARRLIFGPTILIFEPGAAEIETSENTLTIRGQAQNTAYLSLNERPISVDQQGFFEEKLLLSPSFNIIEMKAKDRFKTEVRKTIKVYYKPAATTTAE